VGREIRDESILGNRKWGTRRKMVERGKTKSHDDFFAANKIGGRPDQKSGNSSSIRDNRKWGAIKLVVGKVRKGGGLKKSLNSQLVPFCTNILGLVDQKEGKKTDAGLSNCAGGGGKNIF